MKFHIYDNSHMTIDTLQFYKCLADDTRLKAILLIQQEQELCVCELTTALKASQPKVSRHLAQLRECGLLSDRRERQWIYYQINPDLPDWALNVITISAEASQAFMTEAQNNLGNMGDRPLRQQQCC